VRYIQLCLDIMHSFGFIPFEDGGGGLVLWGRGVGREVDTAYVVEG